MSDLDFSCKFSKSQYNCLAFVDGLIRATEESLLPEIVQYSPYYISRIECFFFASKELNLYILFAITAAGVVLFGGPKKYPSTSSIV